MKDEPLKLPNTKEIGDARREYLEMLKVHRESNAKVMFSEAKLASLLLCQINSDLQTKRIGIPFENFEEIGENIEKILYRLNEICDLLGYQTSWSQDFFYNETDDEDES